MAVNDIYEASIHQELNGEELYNVFTIQQIETIGGAADLATRIINQWITANWDTLVVLGLSFVEIVARNLFDPTEVATVPVGQSGGVVADPLPIHDALYMSLNTPDADKQGGKRFGGLAEDAQSIGEWGAITLTAWNTFANTVLNTPIIGPGGTLRYQNVIVKRIPYIAPSGNVAYRLPQNIGEASFAQVVAGVSSSVVRTQKSRSYIE